MIKLSGEWAVYYLFILLLPFFLLFLQQFTHCNLKFFKLSFQYFFLVFVPIGVVVVWIQFMHSSFWMPLRSVTRIQMEKMMNKTFSCQFTRTKARNWFWHFCMWNSSTKRRNEMNKKMNPKKIQKKKNSTKITKLSILPVLSQVRQ